MVRDWVDTAREILDIVFPSMTRPRGERHLPPAWLRDVGPSGFEETGKEFLRYFTELASLQCNESVLEIGCGPGRMALPLTGYLHDGVYVGVDVTARAVVPTQHLPTFSPF